MAPGIRDLLALTNWTVHGVPAPVTPDTGAPLFIDYDIEVVQITLNEKTGGTITYLFSLDFWDIGKLYSTNPVIYPLLASAVTVVRSVGDYISVREEVEIPIYAKSHLDVYGISFLDFRKAYEFHNSQVKVYYYPKPGGGPATHVETSNLRAVLEIVDAAYDDPSGVLRLRCRGTWFKDKELNPKLEDSMFLTAEAANDAVNEPGSWVFGQSTIATDGIAIDAPVLIDEILDTGLIDVNIGHEYSSLSLFAGWTALGHQYSALKRLMVRNQHKEQDDTEWLQVDLEADPQAAAFGNAEFSDIGDHYPRHLSLYSRAHVYSPGDHAKILTCVQARIVPNRAYWAADFNGSNNLYLLHNSGVSPGDKDFTLAFWIRFDTLRDQAIIGKGNFSDISAEWWVRMNASNQLVFGISSTGDLKDREVTDPTAPSVGLWYWVVAWHDELNNTINIQVNNGTVTSATTLVHSGTFQGAKNPDDDTLGYVTLAASASNTDNTYTGYYFTITTVADIDADEGNYGDTREIVRYRGSNRRAYIEQSINPLPNSSDTYVVTVIPSKKYKEKVKKRWLDIDKEGPLQIGYMGGITNHLDGQMCMLAFWSGVLGDTQKASIYNGSNGKAYENLGDSEKTNMVSWWDLNEFTGKRVDQHSSRDLSDAGFVASVPGKVRVSITAAHGELMARVYNAKHQPQGNTWSPEGSPIRETKMDISDSVLQIGTAQAFFQIDPPLVMSADANYMITLEWSNVKDHAYSFWANYRSSAGSGHYARLNSDENKDKGWTLQTDVELGMALYFLGEGPEGFFPGPPDPPLGFDFHAYYQVSAKAPRLTASEELKSVNKELEFKICLEGLKDDAAGTYTGSSMALIKNPADILKFLLYNNQFGVGGGSVILDDAALVALRSLLANLGLSGMQIALRDSIFARDFLVELCRQGRFRFYKTRMGKLSANYPTPFNSADYTLNEAVLRADLTLLGVQDLDEATIANDFKQVYAPDEFNVPKDPAFLRRSGTNKYSGLLEMTATESTSGDAYRQGLCATSQALFGKREHTRALDYYDDSTPAQIVQNYTVDRFVNQQQVCVVRVLRRNYYTSIDLFSKVRIQHSGLNAEDGTGFVTRPHNASAKVLVYNEGVPSVVWQGGTIEGEVIEVRESGPFMDLTIQTMSMFNS